MNYTINFAGFTSVFAMPKLSDQTLCTASCDALKVILYVMQHQNHNIDAKYLADRLMLTQNSVMDSLAFWERQGLLKAQGEKAPVHEKKSEQILREEQTIPSPQDAAKVSMGLHAQKKTMSIDEIHALSQQDNSIQQLVEAVQAQMGKVLTRSEIETLVSFYTYAGLPPEYILLAAAHCCAQNRPNMHALSKLITNMMSDNVYTYEQAEEYLTRRQQQSDAQAQVRSAFGLYDRALTRQEQKYIDTWYTEYHFDISLIKLAYEKTINQINKVSFPYINKILSSWHDKGITTTKEAAVDSQKKPPLPKQKRPPLILTRFSSSLLTENRKNNRSRI